MRIAFSLFAGFSMLLLMAGGGACSAPVGSPGGGTNVIEVPDPEQPGEADLVLDLGGGARLELMAIPAGSFQMGSESGEADEAPVHPVTISKSFYMGRFEVTQNQWRAVMGTDPSFNGIGTRLPVESVRWNDVVAFCDEVTEMTGRTVRLPTEAEWEYACRAGTTTEYSFGDDAGEADDYAWYFENSISRTQTVGEKLPNAWGLYDMHGNVGEWCNDWYLEDYYASSPMIDPPGPDTGDNRVLRGGTITNTSPALRSANRDRLSPTDGSINVGFRVVVE